MTKRALSLNQLKDRLNDYRNQSLIPPKEYPFFTNISDCEITSVTHDSRCVVSGSLYVALAGRNTHGAHYISQALNNGAVAVALPSDTPNIYLVELNLYGPVPVLWLTPQTQRGEMAFLAEWVYGSPIDHHQQNETSLSLIGITGTNGKTTTSSLLADIIDLADGDVGLIGTIETRGGGIQRTSSMTTMESPDLHAHYQALLTAGVRKCVMEVSSIGIEESRVAASQYYRAAFLNLSEDHLDYHGDMNCYAEAKLKLFTEHLTPDALSVVCMDGESRSHNLAKKIYQYCQSTQRPCWRYTLNQALDENVEKPDIYWQTLQLSPLGINGHLCTPLGNLDIFSPLMGSFNAANVAVAVALALSIGIDHNSIQIALSKSKIKGRMEKIELNDELSSKETSLNLPAVRVDYAHTPDALERAITEVKSHCRGQLWVIFGCGGDRDISKRPLMGAATKEATGVIITSDNPRDEDPITIIDQIRPGLEQIGLQNVTDGPQIGKYWIEPDRALAIHTAIKNANSSDLILIAGKGHEPYQEGPSGIRVPFLDQEYALEALYIKRHHCLNTVESLDSTYICLDAGGRLIFGQHQVLSGATIDTRKLQENTSLAFFCLQGQRDGHEFIPSALDHGVKTIVVKRGWSPSPSLRKQISQLPVAIIEVADPAKALALWAIAHRQRVFQGVMIGLTGSNGKTSTKELLAHALAALGPTLATQGNFNNHLGVPLTLLRLTKEHHFAVIEMGMNAPGEIAELTSWVKPDLGLITTIASAHLEGLGSLEAVAAAKGELITQCNQAPVILPANIALTLRQIASQEALNHLFKDDQKKPTVYVLPSVTSETHTLDHEILFPISLMLRNINLSIHGSHSQVELGEEWFDLHVQVPGRHQIENARLALAAGFIASTIHDQIAITDHALDQNHLVTMKKLINGLAQSKPAILRGEILQYPRLPNTSTMQSTHQESQSMVVHGNLWVDCYNANPQSMLAAVRTFFSTEQDGPYVLILGMIGELGDHSQQLHFELGQNVYSLMADETYVFTMGDHAKDINQGLISLGFPSQRLRHYNIDQISALSKAVIEVNPSSILLKGSRSIRLERLIEPLQASRS